MSKIKTKNTVKDIKLLDKAASSTAHMKNAFIRSKKAAESTQESEHHSGIEYATDRVTAGANDVTQKAADQLKNPHKTATTNVNRAKEQFQKARQQMPKARKEAAEKAKRTADNAVKTADSLKDKAEQAQKTAQNAQKSVQEAKRTFQQTRTAGRQTIRTAKQADKTIKTSAKTARATGKGTIKTVKQSVKTAEQAAKTTVKTAQKTAKAAQQSARAAAKAARTAAKASRAAAKTAVKTAKTAAKASVAMVKAAIAAIKGLVAAIAAGGSVAVIVVIVIVLIGLLIGSPYGIFFSGEATTEDTMPLSAVQSQIQAQYNARIAEVENSVSHDAVIRHGEMPDFVEIVADFAVLSTMREDGLAADVVIIDADRAQRLIQVFWDMCEINYEVVIHTSESVNESGETVTVESRVLHIYTMPKTYEDMPDYYNFSRQQTELLCELMENRDMLMEVIGQSGWYTSGADGVNMTDAELYELAAYYGVTLPENLSIERKNVLAAGLRGCAY